jgi:hypothetical protein
VKFLGLMLAALLVTCSPANAQGRGPFRLVGLTDFNAEFVDQSTIQVTKEGRLYYSVMTVYDLSKSDKPEAAKIRWALTGYTADCDRKTIKIVGMAGFSLDRRLFDYVNPKVPQLETAYADHHREFACSHRIEPAYAGVRPISTQDVFSYADYAMRDHARKADK